MNTNRVISFDIAKFFACLFVVSIHAQPLKDIGGAFWLTTLARLAVPLFFTISTYLLFIKVGSCKIGESGTKVFSRYILRLVRLLLVWSFIEFSLVHLFEPESLAHASDIVRFFISPGFALWFLVALILGTLFHGFLYKVLSPKVRFCGCLILGIVGHCLCVGLGEFYSLMPTHLQNLSHAYTQLFSTDIECSTVSSLAPIALGIIFSSTKQGENLLSMIRSHRRLFGVLFVGLLLIFFMEAYLTVVRYKTIHSPVVFSMLLPCNALLFGLLLTCPTPKWLPTNVSTWMSQTSLLIYVLHPIFLFLLHHSAYHNIHSLIRFFVVVFACFITSSILLMLKKRIPFLKYLL